MKERTMIKNRILAIAGSAVALSLSLTSAPAFAAINFDTATWSVGGVTYQFESNGSDTYGGIEYPVTAAQDDYAFGYEEQYFGGREFDSYEDYGYCLGATATEMTEANGDVVITCEAYELEEGIWFTNSYRLYNDQPLARHVTVVENRGNAPIDMDIANDNTFVIYFWFDDAAKRASSNDPLTCSSLDANDNWVIAAGSDDTTIAAMVWQAKGATALSAEGENCGAPYVAATKDTLGVGEKVNYMTFIATSAPAGSSSAEMDTALASAISQMSAFDSLNDTLCRGINGFVLEGWGTCGLAETGMDSAQLGSALALGASLAAVGTVALVANRRRTARV
jgi:hypothetical protein